MSAAASIKTVIQITGLILSYLRDVKYPGAQCSNLTIELASIRGILDTLLDTFENMEDPADWMETIQLLGDPQSPLVLLRPTLENLLA